MFAFMRGSKEQSNNTGKEVNVQEKQEGKAASAVDSARNPASSSKRSRDRSKWNDGSSTPLPARIRAAAPPMPVSSDRRDLYSDPGHDEMDDEEETGADARSRATGSVARPDRKRAEVSTRGSVSVQPPGDIDTDEDLMRAAARRAARLRRTDSDASEDEPRDIEGQGKEKGRKGKAVLDVESSSEEEEDRERKEKAKRRLGIARAAAAARAKAESLDGGGVGVEAAASAQRLVKQPSSKNARASTSGSKGRDVICTIKDEGEPRPTEADADEFRSGRIKSVSARGKKKSKRQVEAEREESAAPAYLVAPRLVESVPRTSDFTAVQVTLPDGSRIGTMPGPNGETLAVSTDAQGRVLCDRDGVPIPLDSDGKPMPLGSDGRLLKPLKPVPAFTMLMVAGCLAGFGMSLWTTGGIAPLNVNPTIGPSAEAMVACGAKVSVLITGPAKQWWRLLSPLWLHAGAIHLVGNMTLLWRYGQVLELTAGFQRYAALYVASGLFSVVVSANFAPGAITVGASGAIFGIFGAFLAELVQNYHLIPTMRERCTAFFSLTLSIAFNLAMGLLPFVDNYAHLGGLVAGFLLGFPMLVYNTKPKPKQETEAEGAVGSGKPPRAGVHVAEVGTCTTAQFTLGAVGILAYLLFLGVGLAALANSWSAISYCPGCKSVSCLPTPWWTCPDLSGVPAGFGPTPTPTPSASTKVVFTAASSASSRPRLLHELDGTHFASPWPVAQAGLGLQSTAAPSGAAWSG